MSHRFQFSEEWGKKLREQAPQLSRSVPYKIVKENDCVVSEGRFVVPGSGQQDLPPPPPTERIKVPAECNPADASRLFETTTLAVANIDTLSAALALANSGALNFANAYTPGGGYRHNARAQEEDLCRLLPQLIHSLEAMSYPIRPDECLVTRGLAAVRQVGSYEFCPSMGSVNMLTSAMPCGDAGRPGCKTWNDTVNLRIRAVLHAAKTAGFDNLVLGAFGCGAFGNPPDLVAAIFREVLRSPEFRGAFSNIVFAIIDPRGDGNLAPFTQEIAKMHELAAVSVSRNQGQMSTLDDSQDTGVANGGQTLNIGDSAGASGSACGGSKANIDGSGGVEGGDAQAGTSNM